MGFSPFYFPEGIWTFGDLIFGIVGLLQNQANHERAAARDASLQQMISEN